MELLDGMRIARLSAWGWALLRLAKPDQVGVRVLYSIEGEPDLVDTVYPLNTEWPSAYAQAAVEWAGPLVRDPGPFGKNGVPEWPCLRLESLAEIGFALEGRHRLVFQTGRRACARLIWRPQRQPELSVVMDTPCSPKDQLWAGKAFEVLARFPSQIGQKRGRKEGWRVLTIEQVVERARKTRVAWRRKYGEDPTALQLATELGISEATLYRRREEARDRGISESF